jgi:hypothetical protein
VRFNELIREKIRKEASFRDQFRGGEAGASDGSEYDLSYGIGIATDDLISIDFADYFHYAGAGERNAISETINYDLRRGRVIKFDELFRPGSGYEKVISDYCLADLKRQYKGDEDYTDESLSQHVENVVGDEKKWGSTPDGLDIIFDSDEMGPHGAGEANVYILRRRAIRRRVARRACDGEGEGVGRERLVHDGRGRRCDQVFGHRDGGPGCGSR